MKTKRKTFLMMAMLFYGGVASAQVLVKGNVYGGCELGQVTGNTEVTVSGGTIGDTLRLKYRVLDENAQITKRLNHGNVYGGGNGYKITGYDGDVPIFDQNAGRVQGNTTVTVDGDAVVRRAVYGGGNIGSVGVCSVGDDGVATYSSGGQTTVTIGGNALVGPKLEDLTSPSKGELDTARVYFSNPTMTVAEYTALAFKHLGGNEGQVFGGSRGFAGDAFKKLSFADTTIVTIQDSANVLTVFGGGENGHVQKGTNVTVKGNAIVGGMPLHGLGDITVPAGSGAYAGASFNSAVDETSENKYGVGPILYRGNVFAGGKGTDFIGWRPNDEYSYTAGRVYGNTHVSIEGNAKVYVKVYGGGAMASVGTFTYASAGSQTVTGISGKTGHCFVNINGGTIGSDYTINGVYVGGHNNGDVYGGSRGGAGRRQKPSESTLLPMHQLVDMAYVGHTHVNVDGAHVLNSVYGGGANGHVQGDANVLIKETTANTTFIGVENQGDWHSNVYGAGGGTAQYTDTKPGTTPGSTTTFTHHSITAGRVFGDVTVDIQGGKIWHNVYGGGSLASVGKYLGTLPYEGGGNVEINITGGEIGSDGNNNGMVFGSGRGMIDAPDTFMDSLTFAAYTVVNIDGDAKINGSVYGSGENGHVYLSSTINVNGGTIGCSASEYASVTEENFKYRGNVYGAGCGTDQYTVVIGTDPDTGDPITEERYNPNAGIVWGNTNININDGYISRNVYGGGAMASVGILDHSKTVQHDNTTDEMALSWPYYLEFNEIPDENGDMVETGKATININGGHIGTVAAGVAESGNVYGSSRGDAVGPLYVYDTLALARKTEININFVPNLVNAVHDSTRRVIVGSVYGSGENGTVYEDTKVTLTNGLIVGSIFGGGQGTDTYMVALKDPNDPSGNTYLPASPQRSITAGKVYGNTEVIIDGGAVKHNVFGGGNLASVGKGNYIGYGEITTQASGGPAFDEDTYGGLCQVTINGGTIGTDGLPDYSGNLNGFVFGSSKGTTYYSVNNPAGTSRYDYSRDYFLGYANKTEVTIGPSTGSGTGPTIYGSVFGGGEDGHVRWHADVTVNKGTIGVECNVAEANSTTDEWLYRGNVYGAGRGIDKIASGLPHAGEYCSSAGSVTLNSTVIVNGGTIYRNVYGGGSMASVGPPPVANSTYNPGESLSKVEIHGGIIGTLVNENQTDEYLYGGDVFGAGRGNSDIVNTGNISKYASVKASEAHLYDGAHIRGTLYGGGEIGQVKSNSFAYVHGGTADNSVYGAGKGILTDEKAALVLGNSTVDMTGGQVIGSIYGGGEIGNVGTYTGYYNASEIVGTYHVLNEPKGCETGTGLASVYIKGGRVGQNGGEKMPSSNDPDDNVCGYVFAGGSGALVDTTGGQNPKANLLGIVGSTYLEINQADGETPPPAPVITASVYGGCENGLVLGNTHVKIMAGQIGTGYRGGNNWDPAYTDAQWADAIEAVNAGTIGTTYSNPFHECDAFPYQAPYAVYDIYAGTTGYDAQGGSTQGSNGHSFFGNVFGGGSGYYPIKPGVWRRSAGRVWGDTHVEITGGHILTSVYGGNETTDVMGTCTVEMSGGTIGVPRTYDQIRSHPVTCYLFGAGMGDERVMFNTWTNVASTVVRVTGGTIFGSVFGGGEDGHVFGDAEVNIGQDAGKETLIGTLGYSYVDGNVFGGGRGYDGNALTAGLVKGNVTMTIGGGTMLGSIYGGGRLASVGTYLVPAEIDDPSNPGTMIHNPTYGQLIPDGSSTDTHGHITMTISGGTIGNDYTGPIENKGGNVFAGGMGRLEQIDGTTLNTQWPNLAKVKKTNLTITNGTIKGSVYGGGELGTVYEDAVISIEGGTIMRDVFGGGHGSDIIDAAHNGNLYVLTGSSTATTTVVNPAQWAGLVKNNTQLTLSSTGTVKGSMYGGGKLASVGTYTVSEGVLSCTSGGTTTISIEGGTIGDANDYSETNSTYATVPAYYNHYDPSRTDVGHVFGGGKGEGNDPDGDYQLYCNVNTTSIDVSGGRIYGSVFGGAGDAHVLGSTDIDIHTGATIGTLGVSSWDGCVFGGGEGSGYVNTTTGKFEVFKHCGRVGGNTNITMDGGTLMGTIYGGGRVALTGVKENGDPYTSDQNNHGKAIIEVSGGSLGNSTTATLLASNFSVGDIFGAGRGDVDNYEEALAGRVANAQITVSGSPTIYGSVFGGGEMAGVGYRNSSNKFYSGQGETTVTINGGSIGSVDELAYTKSNNPGVWTIYDEDGKLLHTCTGNVFGGSQGDIDITKPAWVSMSSSKTATVTINGGTIMSGVFGGSEQGTVTGDTRVVIKETDPDNHPTTIGHLVNQGSGATHPYYFGYVHGAGYGSDDDDDNVSHTNDSIDISSELLSGRVYGDARLDVLGGTIKGDVYGGASFAYVGGNVLVNIGSHSTRTDVYTGNATFKGSVYGANNLAGTPLGNVEVNVYQTAHTTANTCPTIPSGLTTEEQILAWLSTQPYGEENFAIQAVYGGSNQANYTPVANKKATVHVYRCNENTIRDVYGGCNAAHVGTSVVNTDTEVIIEGGRFYRIFGGGNGELVASDIHGTANTEINGGLINQVFGGSNNNGLIDEINLNINEGGSCPVYIEDVFSGGNAALVLGDVITTVECCNAMYGNFYGGTRLANIYGDVIVNIFGATYNNLFAGSMGQAAQAAVGEPGTPGYQPEIQAIPADIKRFPSTIPAQSAWGEPTSEMYRVYQYMQAELDAGNDLRGHGGNVTLNIFGGIINEAAFGGSDANGNIEGKIQVNVFNTETTCDLDLKNLYGASRNTAYTPTDPTIVSPEINLIHGTVKGNVYGGGQGVTATNTSSPKVNIGYYDDLGVYGHEGDLIDMLFDTIHVHTDNPSISYVWSAPNQTDYLAKVNHDVYGGGDAASMVGNTYVNVNKSNTEIDGYLYGGGKGATAMVLKNNNAFGNTNVSINAGLIKEDVFGAGNEGRVAGNSKLVMNGGTLEKSVFGGGRGNQTSMDGNVGCVEGNSYLTIAKTARILGDAFGGGNVGRVAGNTYVTVKGGELGTTVVGTGTTGGDVYGGGKGYAPTTLGEGQSYAQFANHGVVLGNTYVYVRDSIKDGAVKVSPLIHGIVYGGGEEGSVGTYTIGPNAGLESGGTTNVTVTGGTIGPMDGTGWNAYVFGGSQGMAGDVAGNYRYHATVGTTNVTIDSAALVCGSVLGGGAEGHVWNDANVTVLGGTIGTTGYTLGDGSVLGGGGNQSESNLSAGRVGGNVNVNIHQVNAIYPTHIKGNVYGGGYSGRVGVNGNGEAYTTELAQHGNVTLNVTGGTIGILDYTQSQTNGDYDGIDHHNTGSVFGGGKGSTTSPNFGLVSGNTTVTISGGCVLNNVYGGGEMGSVGQHTVDATTGDFLPVANTGLATVTVNGGQVGPAPKVESGYNIPIGLTGTDGYVFGAGKGDGDDATGAYKAFDNVNNTLVTIDMPMDDGSHVNRIWGSVFGGAEDGHVLGNNQVNFVSGLLGTYGTTSYDGNIFGGGRNYSRKNYTAGRTRCNNTIVMTGGQIYGNIYGGGRLALTGIDMNGNIIDDESGENGAKYGKTLVQVKGGIVGNNTLTGNTADPDETVIETFSDFSMGNVYGGGKGDLEGITGHPAASALLLGLTKNTVVEISDTLNNGTHVYGIVFGGGELANVGKYTWITSGSTIHTINIEDGTGLAKVNISGGTIGGDRSQMRYELAEPNNTDNWYLKYNDDLGYVYGGGEGWSDDPDNETLYPKIYADGLSADPISLLDLMSTVNNTEVTITNDTTVNDEVHRPWVKASVFGGGESGHVRGNTKVTISGGQIGAGTSIVNGHVVDLPPYTDGTGGTTNQFVNPLETTIIPANSLSGTYHWDYAAPYNPYDPAEIRNHYNISTGTYGYVPSDGKSWFGNVFGGGSGWFPYVTNEGTSANPNFVSHWNPNSGKVWGNTEVIITGGHILNNVYGANESTDVGGKATVTISDGTVGVPRTDTQIQDHPVTCYVFGGGCGDPRALFNGITNVDSTNVQIKGGIIYGSVFGGAEDGHVLGNTKVTVSDVTTTGQGGTTTLVSSPIIGSSGTSYYDGNVFGGGRGFLGESVISGAVGGSVTMKIKGGTMLGSIYGGGRLASVGIQITDPNAANYGFMLDDEIDQNNHDNDVLHGHITIDITGGEIGNDVESVFNHSEHTLGGNVFAGGMGRVENLDGTSTNPIWPNLAQVKQTLLTISGDNTIIKGNVYGGGKFGTVTDSTRIAVNGGTIWRDVYGGGYGSDDNTTNTGTLNILNGNTVTTTSVTPMKWAGRVQGNTKVIVTGGWIKKSVYGGGEMASVGTITNEAATSLALSWPVKFTYADNTGLAEISIKGGRIGICGKDFMGPWVKDGNNLVPRIKVNDIWVNFDPNDPDHVQALDDAREDNGDIYGGGKGKSGESQAMAQLANVNNTIISINYPNTPEPDAYKPSFSGEEIDFIYNLIPKASDWTTYGTLGCLTGAVYGGGENGHVNTNTSITLDGGLIGHAVYGGGKGKDQYKANNNKVYSLTAGKVYGDTYVNINGGRVVRSVFGGGNTASVGKGNYLGDEYNTAGYGETSTNAADLEAAANSGRTYVNVYGGTLGTLIPGDPDESFKDNIPYGSVFGGCRGLVKSANNDDPDHTEYHLSFVNNTYVVIGDPNNAGSNPRLYGSVYGGAQDGHVRWNTNVTVNSGIIGANYGSDVVAYTTGTTTPITDVTNVNWTERGNVYGGGSGITTYKDNNVETYSQHAGSVYQKANVIINGGTIHRNVYGGGNLASVGPKRIGSSDCGIDLTKATLNVNQDAVIGTHDDYGGYVYGSSRGIPDNTGKFANFAMVSYTEVNINNGTIRKDVFGGGENGQVGVVNGSETHTTTVNINGGTVSGNVFGGGQGTWGETGYENDQISGRVMGPATVNLNNGTVGVNVYGGGKMGITYGETYANITDGTVNGKVFAGAYGVRDHVNVKGRRMLNMRGGLVKNSIYGGSFNADDAFEILGNATTFNSCAEEEAVSVVNISGGHVQHYVFGAGYYGRTYGSSYLFIGVNAIVNAPNHTCTNVAPYDIAFYADHQDLIIEDDVWAGADFGDYTGGDFGSPTVAAYSNIYIDGTSYNTRTYTSSPSEKYMTLNGSVYGCGTMNEAGKKGKEIIIRNYGHDVESTSGGSDPEPWANATRTIKSIQYADNLIINTSHINLTGQSVVNVLSQITEKYAIYNIFDKVRVVNGSSLYVAKPVKNIGSLHSNICINPEDVYAANPTYGEVNYDALSGSQDNKIRINGGSYLTVSMTNSTGTTYGALRGYFHLMTQGDYNAFAYARPKQSTQEGNIIPDIYDNQDDGGFVSYREEFNTYDLGGGPVDGGHSIQLPYENHTPNMRNGEAYFRIWRYYKQGKTLREVVLYATAKPDNNAGFSYYILDDAHIVDLPAHSGENTYYRIKSINEVPKINYGSEIKLVNAGIQQVPVSSDTLWMNSNANVFGYGQNSTAVATQLEFMKKHPNTAFGLTAIPIGGFEGLDPTTSEPINKPVLITNEAGEALSRFHWQNLGTATGTSSKIQFLLTHSNKVDGNFTWDPISIIMEQVYENGTDELVTDEVEIHVQIITRTVIEQTNNPKTFAMMTHATGGNNYDIYTAKVQLPTFELYDNNTPVNWTLTNVEWVPNTTIGANTPNGDPHDDFNNNTLVEGEPYSYHTQPDFYTSDHVGMKMYTTDNSSNQGWYNQSITNTNALDLGELCNSTTPLNTLLGTSIYNETRPVTFNFDLHYDSDQNVGSEGNVFMGTVKVTVHIDNYKNTNNHELDVHFDVDVYRRGKSKGYYIDGVHGDFAYSGQYPNAAQPSLAGVLHWTDPPYEPGDYIYIVNTVTANSVGNLDWSLDLSLPFNWLKVYRYNGGHTLYSGDDQYYVHYSDPEYRPNNEAFLGPLVDVQSSMSITAAIIDGAYLMDEMNGNHNVVTQGHVVSQAPLINVSDGGTLTLQGYEYVNPDPQSPDILTSYLCNNYNAGSNGGAISINPGGTFKINKHAYLHDNYVQDGTNEIHHGGGVYLEGNANMLVSDDAVLIEADYNAHSNKHVTANKTESEENVYLADYETYISVGTLSTSDSYGPLNDNVRIGVTKPASVWADKEYVPIVFTEDPIHMNNLFGDNIIFDEHGPNTLDIYPEREPNGDPNYLKKLYWIKTWVQAVTEEPSGFDLNNIDTPEELAWVISIVNGLNGATAAPGTTFKITKDIDMSQYIWVPIGTSTNGNEYRGTFEGNGHAITGIHSQLSTDDHNKGMFGVTNNATIQNFQAKVNFFRGGSVNNLGGIVGHMIGGSLNNCESAGYLEGDANTINIGGLVGLFEKVTNTSSSNTIHSCFATDTLHSVRMPEPANSVLATNVGGLIGTSQGDLYNSYSNFVVHNETWTMTSPIGGLVCNNSGHIENCYSHLKGTVPDNYQKFGWLASENTGTIQYCYIPDGNTVYSNNSTLNSITGHGTYKPVKGRKEIGYMYDDNQITLVESGNPYVVSAIEHTVNITKWPGMLSSLNQWVDDQNNNHEGSFTTWFRPTTEFINGDLPVLGFPKDNDMATLDAKDAFLHYSSKLDDVLEVYNQKDANASIFLYGNATDVVNVPDDEVKVFVNEDAVLMQADGADEFNNTTVGITFDNSCGNNTTGNDQVGTVTLNYDWHLLSTPLNNAPLGITYDETLPNYYTSPVDVTGVSGSYFPDNLPTSLNTEPRWDIYTYYEKHYHWINLKRKSANHWHYDYGNQNIPYYGDGTTLGNEQRFVPAKGYMMAIEYDSYLSNTGTLNRGTVTIPLTAMAPDDVQGASYHYNKGSNLVGNPYQAYLDLNMVASGNTISGVKDFYIFDAENGTYVPYTASVSKNPRVPSRYIHPHQGFFVLYQPEDPANNVVDLTLKPSWAGTTKNDDSYFRGQMNYPLVNILAENEDGQRDLAIVELGRPELGGVKKVDNLQNSEFKLYTRLENNDYALLFTPVGTPRIPLFFKTPTDGNYKLTWDTHNGTYSRLTLVDNITGVQYDMLTHDHYDFVAYATDYAARFYILFSVTGTYEIDNDNHGGNFAFFDGTNWVIDGTGQLELLDVTGRVLYTNYVSGDDSRVSLNNYAAGTYMLRLVEDKQNVRVQKIVIY